MKVLLYEGEEYDYYKVPVPNGKALTENTVAKTCQSGK